MGGEIVQLEGGARIQLPAVGAEGGAKTLCQREGGTAPHAVEGVDACPRG